MTKIFLAWGVGYVIKTWLLRLPSDWQNSEQVRVFFLYHGNTLKLLVKFTETTVDDKLVDSVVAAANNKMLWDFLFNATFGTPAVGTDGEKVPPIPLPDGGEEMVRPLRALLDRIRNRLAVTGATA